MTTDRNSEGAFTERHGVDLRGIRVGEVLTQEQWDAVCAFVIDQDRIIDGTAAEVQALVERLETCADQEEMADQVKASEWHAGRASAYRHITDELANLARDYAPEVSPKPPSPRNPE